MSNVTVNKISTPIFEEYSNKDLILVPSFDVISQFTPKRDYVEFSIYNETGNLEYINYDYIDFTVTFDYNTKENAVSTVNVNPEFDLEKQGYTQGNYTTVYNFLNPQLSSSQSNPFYIKEISSDRTEIRVANNNINNKDLEQLVNNFKTELGNSPYFEDFHVNFGNNNIFIANNIVIDTTSDQYTILIKLYEPLNPQFSIKDILWIVIQTAEECLYQVNFANKVIPPPPLKQLKGPNFNLKEKNIVNNSTVYTNNTQLNNTILTSSYNELKSILNKKGIQVNVDYSDFNNFVYFSSAEQRARNFYYKLSLIQSYDDEISELESTSNSSISSSIFTLENNKTQIIQNFDGYEEYQYYSSGSSDIYPKTNSTAPYTLASTGSADALAWLEDQATNSGSAYDLENVDRLVNSLPSYVQDDLRNEPLFLFMDMVGQHFDNIWVYTKDISNRFDADNRLNYGISKDIVADAIRGMGISLYQNNFSSDNLFSSLTGINPGGGLLPPTGSEIIETYISASNNPTILDDVNKEVYKRIFHNLPYLLKTKGTVEGLRALINTYGIPDTILRISEFGGKDKDNSNDWDYFQNVFNYYAYISGSDTNDRIRTRWGIDPDWETSTPKEIFFRFKPELPTNNNEQEYRIVSHIDDSGGQNAYLTLARTGSWNASGSYSGSITSQSREYAELTYWSQGNEVTSVTAPFYDGNWWGVSLNSGSGEFTLKVANKIYDGNEGFKIGYTASATDSYSSDNTWGVSELFYLPADNGSSAVTLNSNDYYGLTGSYQELRFYNISLSENTFHDFVMNPHSIEGLNYSSSAENLVFRAPLGSELTDTEPGTYSSIHPKITGSYITQSFNGGASTYTIGSSVTFPSQTEVYYFDQPAVGIKNRISEKIRTQNHSLPSGNTLSLLTSIQQNYLTPESGSYTKDINLVEIAFSPQNEINDDINSSFGYFNIGDYIGDPRQISESVTSYPKLDKLRDSYFEKYYKNYNWTDYVRIIKYFDNSLFKMIKDFTPAKSSLASGVVIKQHLLERNKQRPPQVTSSLYDYSGSIESGFISGGTGGVFDSINTLNSSISPQITQSWNYTVQTLSGSLIVTQSTQDEFYNGELSGSTITVTNGELNDFPTGSQNEYSTTYTYSTSWGTRVFDDYIVYSNAWQALLSVQPSSFQKSIFVLRQNQNVTELILGYKTPAPEFHSQLSGALNNETFTLTFTSAGGFGSIQTINVPYTFTISTINVVEQGSIGYLQIALQGDNTIPPAPLLNTFIPPTPLLPNVVSKLRYNKIPLSLQKEWENLAYNYNNVLDSRLSSVYQDVDYSNSIISATNQNLITNNSALKAPIQDSNYTNKGWANGRYNGSKVSSVDFNVPYIK